jgi:hypothetical protein
MRSRLHGSRTYGTIAAAALCATALGVSAASAAVDTPIAPHQLFLGQVNGASTGAVIKVGCFGPVTPGQTGHPVSGQSVSVTPALSVPVGSLTGYTGESADHVVVEFGAPATSGPVTLIGSYGVKVPIPTSIELPCYGSGRVAFVPVPTSSTARTATVDVTYQSIGV